MTEKHQCEICKKEIEKGNICTKCSDRISSFIDVIKKKLHQGDDKKMESN